MVTVSETHQPGTEIKRESKGRKNYTEKEIEREKEKKKWRSRSAQVRSVITGFQSEKDMELLPTCSITTDYMLLSSRNTDRTEMY